MESVLLCLPEDIKIEILRKISYHSYLKVALVNRHLNKDLKNERLWSAIHQRKSLILDKATCFDSVKYYYQKSWHWDTKNCSRAVQKKGNILATSEIGARVQAKKPFSAKHNRIRLKIIKLTDSLDVGLAEYRDSRCLNIIFSISANSSHLIANGTRYDYGDKASENDVIEIEILSTLIKFRRNNKTRCEMHYIENNYKLYPTLILSRDTELLIMYD